MTVDTMERSRSDHLDASLEESLAIARELGDRRILAHALLLQGRVAASRGESKRADALFLEGLAAAEAVGDRWVTGVLLLNLGIYSKSEDQPELERARYRKALNIFRELKNNRFLMFALSAWAEMEGGERGARLLGAFESARDAFNAPLSPQNKITHDAAVEKLRSAMDETSFLEAWEKGRAMTLDEAVDFALMDSSSGKLLP
jgi:hypothetical protein